MKNHDEEKDKHEELRRGERANYPSLAIVHDDGESGKEINEGEVHWVTSEMQGGRSPRTGRTTENAMKESQDNESKEAATRMTGLQNLGRWQRAARDYSEQSGILVSVSANGEDNATGNTSTWHISSAINPPWDNPTSFDSGNRAGLKAYSKRRMSHTGYTVL